MSVHEGEGADERLADTAEGGRFAIVVGCFYRELADKLIAGAQAAFEEASAQCQCFEVPGAFELPLAASYAARSGRFDGVACLGAVIRGETDHYQHVCSSAASGIQEVALSTLVPCAFGVLTCETIEQALARAGGAKRDQGRHAAETVIAMAALKRSLATSPEPALRLPPPKAQPARPAPRRQASHEPAPQAPLG